MDGKCVERGKLQQVYVWMKCLELIQNVEMMYVEGNHRQSLVEINLSRIPVVSASSTL